MHGAELTALPALAPALQEQLAPFRPADAGQVWVRWVGTQETEESFSFQVQVIRRDSSGRLTLAGDDQVLVSQLEGGVAVWYGAGPEDAAAPALMDLAAPVLADGAGAYRVPVEALAGGVRTEPLPVAEVDGRSYVQGSDLEAAVDGLRVDLPDGGFRYAVDWRPDLGQLGLWRAVRRPIS